MSSPCDDEIGMMSLMHDKCTIYLNFKKAKVKVIASLVILWRLESLCIVDRLVNYDSHEIENNYVPYQVLSQLLSTLL